MMRDIGIEVIVALALLAAGAAGGYAWRGSADAQRIDDADSARAVCDSALAANQTVITNIKRTLDEAREQQVAALAAAEQAIAARDGINAALNARVAAIKKSLKEALHEDVCNPLARQHVCAAVAGKLWPVPADTADHHAH